MSKFNNNVTMKTTNKSGHVAYKMQDKEKLVSMVLTTMFGEPKFYGDNSSELVKLAEEICQYDPEFVSRLAVYARNVFNMRSVSHVLTCIVAHYGRGIFTRKAIAGVVQRPDDITEIMSCYIKMYGKPIPNALKRQISIQMNKINEYGFAKYNGGNKEITFKDVLRICHPAPTNTTQDTLFNKIMTDSLETPYTWEVELSTRGNTKEVWEELIDSGKVGYMALLRNLANIIKANPKNINKVYDTLRNADNVHKSRQLPFRFFSAYKTLEEKGLLTSKIADVLEDAISASVDNMEKIKGKTLIAIDVSGSMSYRISDKSTVRCSDISRLLGCIANRICEDAVIVTFDTSLKEYVHSSRSGILSSTNRMWNCGGGTNLRLPMMKILKSGEYFDRMIMLSDNEINCSFSGFNKTCMSDVNKYRKTVNPNFWVHAIDLMGYGTQQYIGDKTNIIAGWSERALEFINTAESGLGGIVQAIMSYSKW